MSAVLGIGTASFLAAYGLGTADRAGEAVLREAVAAGVSYIDTAADYGDAERAVGRARDVRVRVATKIKPGDSDDAVRASVARLGGPPDTILMHSAGREQLEAAPAVGALERARAAGQALRIGASTYGSDDARLALAQPWVDAVQVEYSILNQSVLRSIAGAEHRRKGQEVIARSVLCKGLLTSRRYAAPALLAPVAEAVTEIEACARDWGLALETLAIRFALDAPGVDVALVGVSTIDELRTALAAADAPPLTRDQWARLAAYDRSDSDAVHPERWSRAS
jgi:aryl-alcohol dehydrogenase-like predicted oxidoreductase